MMARPDAADKRKRATGYGMPLRILVVSRDRGPVMPESTTPPAAGMIDHAAIDKAHELATRDALLEHARMGRDVHEWRDGRIVTVTPPEIFARYGLDENGRPKAQ